MLIRVFLSLIVFITSFAAIDAKAAHLSKDFVSVTELEDIREPSTEDISKSKETNEPITPSGMSDFASSPFKLNTTKAQLPIESRIRMIVETPHSAKHSKLGDPFKAQVRDDFFMTGGEGSKFKKLIIPKHSWIRGKVNYIKKPRLMSRSGKLGIKLDSLITPNGDYVALDANLTFQRGIVNKDGFLDPQTGFKDKAIKPTKSLLSSGTGKAVSIATVGTPVVGTLLVGSVVALFSKGDVSSLYKGQELQIIVTRNVDLDI